MEMTKGNIIKIFSKIPTLKTERLMLRRLLPSDFMDMYEYSCLPDVTKYLLWHPHADSNQTYRYLENVQSYYKRGEFYDWAIVFKENNKMIGTCGYTSIDVDNFRVEIGYVLNPEYWGKGIAAEAILAAEEFAFFRLGANRVEARFIEGNDRSLKVMLKCQMKFEGYLRQYMKIKGEYKNIGICSVTRDSFLGKGFYSEEPKKMWLKKIIKS